MKLKLFALSLLILFINISAVHNRIRIVRRTYQPTTVRRTIIRHEAARKVAKIRIIKRRVTGRNDDDESTNPIQIFPIEENGKKYVAAYVTLPDCNNIFHSFSKKQYYVEKVIKRDSLSGFVLVHGNGKFFAPQPHKVIFAIDLSRIFTVQINDKKYTTDLNAMIDIRNITVQYFEASNNLYFKCPIIG